MPVCNIYTFIYQKALQTPVRYMNKLIFAIGIIFSIPIQAETAYPLIAYACDKNNNEIIIINSQDYESDPPSKYYHNDDDSLQQYDPWKLVTITDDEKGTRITDTSEIKEECNLKYGDYTIYIRPEIFNGNVLGRCGAAISGNISIMSGNKVILDEIALQEDCHVKKYIKKIKIIEIRQHESGAIVYNIDITTTEPFFYFGTDEISNK